MKRKMSQLSPSMKVTKILPKSFFFFLSYKLPKSKALILAQKYTLSLSIPKPKGPHNTREKHKIQAKITT